MSLRTFSDLHTKFLNESEHQRNSARRHAVWPIGRTEPSYRVRAQVCHWSQQWAHADQFPFETEQLRHRLQQSRDHNGCVWKNRPTLGTVDFTTVYSGERIKWWSIQIWFSDTCQRRRTHAKQWAAAATAATFERHRETCARCWVISKCRKVIV